ncbi:MAG: FG-GAP repeat protein [Gemmataceae bacterium]|nr:FG-GAP repeat protein [Gemmataceae bacterium]
MPDRRARPQVETLEVRTVPSHVGSEFKLLPDDIAAGDNVGFSVAIDGDTAVVGSAYDGPNQTGAAYVFVRRGHNWVQQAKLTASDAAEGDRFGNGVAVSGDTILVGAPGQYTYGEGGDRPGSAYIFVRKHGGWTEQAQLTPSGSEDGDFFGSFVSLDNNTAVIGALLDSSDGAFAGAAYAFGRQGKTWTEQVNFADLVDNTDLDFLGSWVAIDGNTAIVTAQGADGFQGEAHVFVRLGKTWTPQAELHASDGAPGDFFGWYADLDGDTAVITAPYDDDYTGAAYVFKRRGQNWTEQQKLTASDGAPGDRFGTTVAISGRNILVGQGYLFPEPVTGSAYLFQRSGGGGFTEVGRFTASDTEEGDLFGLGIDIDGNGAIVGAFRADPDGLVDAGAAYIFRVNALFDPFHP